MLPILNALCNHIQNAEVSLHQNRLFKFAPVIAVSQNSVLTLLQLALTCFHFSATQVQI
jgi:hypothetical protein